MAVTRKQNGMTPEFSKEYHAWHSMKQRCLNKESHNFSRWSLDLGGERNLVCKRLSRGWDVERAITTEARR